MKFHVNKIISVIFIIFLLLCGTSYSAGNGSYSFVASNNDYMTLLLNGGYQPGTADFSIGAWFKTGTTGTSKFIFCHDQGTSDSCNRDADDEGFGIVINSNESFGCFISDNGSTSVEIFSGDTSYVDDEWHNIICTFDRDGNGVLYADGVSKASSSITGENGTIGATAGSFSLEVGRSTAFGGSGYFDGELNFIWYANQLYTADQVTRLSQMACPPEHRHCWDLTQDPPQELSNREEIVNNGADLNESGPPVRMNMGYR